MDDSRPDVSTFAASDGYALHVERWATSGAPRARVVVLHGVQSHAGWYHNLGRTLAGAGFETYFPDRRGSGSNRPARGHAPSARRLTDDLAELLASLRGREPKVPQALAGISWGGKLAVLEAASRPDLVDAVALICPGLHPRVDISLRERLAIALALVTGQGSRTTFPIPLNDPALFTASPEGQRFIANDPLGLKVATAGLLAASFFIDRSVGRAARRIRQPALLMVAGQDRIVDNARTLQYFEQVVSTEKRVVEYPEGHHTLEFEPDPSRYARDLAAWLGAAVAG